MTVVTARDSAILSLLQAVLDRWTSDRVQPIFRSFAGLEKTTKTDEVMSLARDSLKKGLVGFLAKEGWKPKTSFIEGKSRTGRIWERYAPEQLKLEFTSFVPDVLDWAGNLKWEEKDFPSDSRTMKNGDELFLVLFYDATRKLDIGKILRKASLVQKNGLVQLAFAGDFHEATNKNFLFSKWFEKSHSPLFDALQSYLASCWVRTAQEKERIKDFERLRKMGQREALVLSGWLDFCEKKDRRDLAFFLPGAVKELLTLRPDGPGWVGWIDVSKERLADRSDFFEEMTAVLQMIERMNGWECQYRSVGYYDENYAFSQFWKDVWEKLNGESLFQKGQEIRESLRPLNALRELHAS